MEQVEEAEKEEEEKDKSGNPADIENLYDKQTRTSSQVFTDFGNKVKSAGFWQAAMNFFTVTIPGGACSGLSLTTPVGWGQIWTIDATPYFCSSTAETVFQVLSIGVLIAAMWVAFKIALL